MVGVWRWWGQEDGRGLGVMGSRYWWRSRGGGDQRGGGVRVAEGLGSGWSLGVVESQGMVGFMCSQI